MESQRSADIIASRRKFPNSVKQDLVVIFRLLIASFLVNSGAEEQNEIPQEPTDTALNLHPFVTQEA